MENNNFLLNPFHQQQQQAPRSASSLTNLPPVAARSPQLAWHSDQQRSSPAPPRWTASGVSREATGSIRSWSQSMSQSVEGGFLLQNVSLDPATSYNVDDLNNYSMTDQSWTLHRKKIGLKRRTQATRERRVRDRESKNLNVAFIRKYFKRKECIRYVHNPKSKLENACYCGEQEERHFNPSTYPPKLLQGQRQQAPGSATAFSFQTVTEEEEDDRSDDSLDDSLKNSTTKTKRRSIFESLNLSHLRSSVLAPISLPTFTRTSSPKGHVPYTNSSNNNNTNNIININLAEDDADDREQDTMSEVSEVNETEPAPNPLHHILTANGITSRSRGRQETEERSEGGLVFPPPPPIGVPAGGGAAPPGGVVEDKWTAATHIREYPTNAYGTINFVNETTGSNKPSKYVRLAADTPMESILTLLADYWHLMDPLRPQLVISVTGGAKNFRLDGKKKATFTTGLIRAVKSTNAWILTGGMHVGVMRSVGEAVNQGQYIVKIKRKSVFAEDREHLIRGIRCLGVLPWGYILNRDGLVNTNLNKFASVKYKVEDNFEHLKPISLNGDHTHFLFVDDGSRNSFKGIDEFRTELEEAIMEEEPRGFGVPVILLLVEGGLNSIFKCTLALRRNIPIVVVAGTGRAADLMAFAATMTLKTPSGRYIMRKGHKTQLMNRISIIMKELEHNDQKQKCMDSVIECCTHLDRITIFDINSNEDMDRYILYALLTGKTGDAQTSLLDQLGLALLWDRPDIAESHIFTAQPTWPTGALEDLMTTALMEEKVEFVKLFVVNGLVMEDFLTVGKLRQLYNQAMSSTPNSHLTKMLQRSSRQLHNHHLLHVHNLLQVVMRHHHDPPYLADTPEAATSQPHVSYLTFEDPYQELLLWSILTRRTSLARYLWIKCESPLTASVASACLYQALWRSLGAKNTDIRQEYLTNKREFEKLAVDLLCQCYTQDPMNAMGLVERRIAKWGDMDCLEMAQMYQNMAFIASPASQASIELGWRRGMIRAPFYAVLLANVLPFLIFVPKLFKFHKLGDNRGELTPFQKLIVFYKSPISKFGAHSSIFVLFLLLYAYVVLFDFKYEMSTREKILLVWMASYLLDEISEVASEQATTLRGKLAEWYSSVWNRFDLVALFLGSLALGLRLNRETFSWGRIAYAVNTTIFYCRLLRIYHINYHLGPKLIIFYRMISEVAVFLALLVIFILAYGIASQSLLHLNRNSVTLSLASIANIANDVILMPYWQMYGELLLDELTGVNEKLCHSTSCSTSAYETCDIDQYSDINSTSLCGRECLCEHSKDYSWVINFMLIFYLIIGNIMLLNLLIAIFTYVFDEVQENSMEIWKYEMFRLIREYDHKPTLIPPLNALEYCWRAGKKLWKVFLRKKRENLDDYMKESLNALRIFEKEVIQTYQQRIAQAEESSVENSIKRMSEKINKIAKYIDQKEELEEIEEDLEWIMKEAEELKHNKELGQSAIPISISRPASSRTTRPNTTRFPYTPSPMPPSFPITPQPPLPQESNGENGGEEQKPTGVSEEPGDLDEELDVLTEELFDEDIEKELSHLQQKMVESRPFSGHSRAGTPNLVRYKADQQVTRRLDHLHHQFRSIRDSVDGFFGTVLDRLDRMEEGLNKKKEDQ